MSIRRWGVAAAIFIMACAVSLYFILPANRKDIPVHARSTAHAVNEVIPGSTGAILTLADGRKIALDNLPNGTIAKEQGALLSLSQGQLNYASAPDAAGNSGLKNNINSLVTPKGRQFCVVLPDGTKAWLNAASSLTYPTVFAGKERRVTITGEVYFDVVRDKNKPFFAVSGKHVTEVLGTRFNINSYNNEESVKIALLDGSIRVHTGAVSDPQHKSVLLKPGQQTEIDAISGKSVVKTANPDEVSAWREGYFYFKNADIRTVMRELERWYDINVIYKGNPTTRSFEGKIQKDLSLSELLFGLGRTDIHFRMEGRDLIVLP